MYIKFHICFSHFKLISDGSSVQSRNAAEKIKGRPTGQKYICQKCGVIFKNEFFFLTHQKDHDLKLDDQKFFITDIKIENDPEAVDVTYEFEYIEIENLDIKEEIVEGKFLLRNEQIQASDPCDWFDLF